MSRQLLNDLPDGVLAVIFIGVAVIFTLAAIALVKRFVPQWRDPESGDKVVGVAAMVMTLFALLLAFVIVNLYNGYESASDHVSAEANSLSKVVTDVHVFPRVEQKRMDAAVAQYVQELRTREFALLRDGHSDPRAQGYLNAMIETLERYSPAAEAQTAFYSVTADDLAALATQRNDRIDAAEASIPAPLWGLLILLAVLTLVTSIMLRTRSFGLDLLLCLSIAAVVGAGMVTASILEYPFSGSIAVSSAPFDRADLNQVLQSHP